MTILFVSTGLLSLAGAGYSGFAFADSPNDQVLLQMVFYGAWTTLIGSWVGGHLGAMCEEDACSAMDMGVLSSMGAFFGALAGGVIGTAATGLALEHGWFIPWIVAVGLGLVLAVSSRVLSLEVRRQPHLDRRGLSIGPEGVPLPDEQQPLRMKDRVAVLMAMGFVFVLGLTLVMARMMGWNLGHPAMLAPMMYGMSGTMAGGMLGGWLAGVLDEHRGAPDRDNPIMVAAMALMAGMMGGMPSGMIGGMMAVMGESAIAITIASGVVFTIAAWLIVMRGRYRVALRAGSNRVPAITEPAPCDEVRPSKVV